MKTRVKSVLVIPDDPSFSQPMPVKIRTEKGDLMTHRLEKMIREDKLVFASKVLACDIHTDIHCKLLELDEWQKELIWLKCRSDCKTLQYLLGQFESYINDETTEYGPEDMIRMGLACRKLLKEIINETNELLIIKKYRKLEKECATKH